MRARTRPTLYEQIEVLPEGLTGEILNGQLYTQTRPSGRHGLAESSLIDELVGESAALRRVLRQVEQVAPTDSTVLILGETGTGKDLIATAIHKCSRFEVADGGTLVPDEIGELPLDLQAKLLRVLQSGEFERLGSTVRRRSDARVIASTNRDLE